MGEVAQGFTRLCAVHRGLYALRTYATHVLTETEKGVNEEEEKEKEAEQCPKWVGCPCGFPLKPTNKKYPQGNSGGREREGGWICRVVFAGVCCCCFLIIGKGKLCFLLVFL